jgi:Fe-S-cluster containining protein
MAPASATTWRGRRSPGSPRAMTDGTLRRIAKWLALQNFNVNVYFHRRQQRRRGQEHYLLGGDCRLCARCCEAPTIQVGFLTWNVVFLRRIFLAWQKHVNGFDLTGRDPIDRSFVFRCSHFDWTTRRCDSYDSRPGMCRDYPRLLLEQPRPEFLPGCGYRAVWRKAESMNRALEEAGVPDETLKRLRQDLYLGDRPSKDAPK